MSDSDLIEKFQAETHYQLGNDVIQDLINMVREHDTTIPDRMRRIDNLIEDERAKTLAEVREAVRKLKDGPPVKQHDLVIDKALKAIDGVEK